jgi:hypothetical protein
MSQYAIYKYWIFVNGIPGFYHAREMKSIYFCPVSKKSLVEMKSRVMYLKYRNFYAVQELGTWDSDICKFVSFPIWDWIWGLFRDCKLVISQFFPSFHLYNKSKTSQRANIVEFSESQQYEVSNNTTSSILTLILH